MNTQILENIGFTKGEIRVYLALLELGNTTSGPIIIKSKVSRSKVYEILERLAEKGLATESIKENIKYFQATSPERINDYLKQKEKSLKAQSIEFQRFLPQLKEKQKSSKEKQEVKIYIGYEGLKTFYNEALSQLKKGEEYLVITKENLSWEDKSYTTFIANLHQKRLDKKLHVKVLFNSLKGSFQQKNIFKNKSPYYEIREIPLQLPSSLVIFKDTVAITSWEKSIRLFAIICKDVADQYKQFFHDLWNSAKK